MAFLLILFYLDDDKIAMWFLFVFVRGKKKLQRGCVIGLLWAHPCCHVMYMCLNVQCCTDPECEMTFTYSAPQNPDIVNTESKNVFLTKHVLVKVSELK